MTKQVAVLFFMFFIFLPRSAYAAEGSDESLTLLHKPQKNAPSLQQMQPSGQPQELRDIHGPVKLKDPSRTLIYAAAIGVLLLLVSAAALVVIKGRKKAAPPPLPPWEKALLELAEARVLLSSNRVLPYMDRVSMILRKYVESRFAIKSTRQTTREFLSNLNNASADPAIRSCKGELQTCLEQCDMAKFAHQIPLQQNMEMVEKGIITFVEKTRPHPEQKGEAA